MRFNRLNCIVTAIIVALSYTGCTKPDVDTPPPPPPSCGVWLFNGLDATTDDTLHFGALSHNAAGDPIGRGFSFQDPQRYPNLEFRYDQQNRLTDMISYFGSYPYTDGSPFEEWHRYYYDIHGRIHVDSTLHSGPLSTDPGTTHNTSWTNYRYDYKNRIIRKDVVNTSHMLWKKYYYTYNSDNNLSKVVDSLFEQGHRYGHVTTYRYDTSTMNVNRLSKVYQFINEDYSINSQNDVLNTVRDGLPYELRVANGFKILFFGVRYGGLRLSYNCRSQTNVNKIEPKEGVSK